MPSYETSLLRRIRIASRRKMNTLFAGEYRSAFRGTGLNFDSVREYQYGDEVRSIDWNVSARMRGLFVKEYIEERELNIVLAVDLSASTAFGTARSKRDIVLETATLFLYLAQASNDRVSVLLFSDRVEKYMKPRKGRKFLLEVLRGIVSFRPAGRRTDISAALEFLERVLKKRSVVFVISDFLDEGYEGRLRRLGRRHDVIPVEVSDPAESRMPLFALAEFVDMETGETFLSEAAPVRREENGDREVESIKLSTDKPIEGPILKYFEKRNRARRLGI